MVAMWLWDAEIINKSFSRRGGSENNLEKLRRGG
jgi:hypothetical protein